jgi:hypothetical protein
MKHLHSSNHFQQAPNSSTKVPYLIDDMRSPEAPAVKPSCNMKLMRCNATALYLVKKLVKPAKSSIQYWA